MTPLNILVAFPYFSKQILEFLKQQDHSRYRLMVDSGAFTAHMSGEPINLDDYCKFLDAIECLRPFHAVQLDVIGDHEASLKNYEIMKSRGYDVLPVFTRGSPLELLDSLFTTTDYILIGGVAVGEQRQGYVKYLIPHIKQKKVHLLGFTNLNFIKELKPFSIDSSGWESGGRFGRLHFYQKFGKFESMSRSQFLQKSFVEICKLAKKSGLTSDQVSFLKIESSWRGSTSSLSSKGAVRWLGAYAYIAQAQEIEKNIGTQSYLALATDLALKILFNAYDLYKNNHS